MILKDTTYCRTGLVQITTLAKHYLMKSTAANSTVQSQKMPSEFSDDRKEMM